MNEPVSMDRAEHVHDLLSEYLNGDLDDARRQAVRTHLEGCAACRRDYESLRLTVQLVRQVPLRPAPRSFAIAAPPARQRLSLTWLRISTGALAALFVAVMALQLVLPTTVQPTASSASATDAASRASAAYSAARPTAPAAAPRQAAPALAAAQARSIPEESSGRAPTAAASAPMAAAAQSAPAAAQAPAPIAAKSASASTQGEPALADTTVASEPTMAVAQVATPLPQPITREPIAPTPAAHVVPAWYLPLLVAVGALFVISLAGLIWITARRSSNVDA